MRRALVSMIVVTGIALVSASHAGECEAIPMTVTRTTTRVTDTKCDASCGPLQSLKLGAPALSSGTGLGPGGKLEFVDQWHGECEIRGGPLNAKCKAWTVCLPGETKFQDDGVWKCRSTTSVQAPNPARIECVAKAATSVPAMSIPLSFVQRLEEIGDAYGKGQISLSEAKTRFRTFVNDNKLAPWIWSSASSVTAIAVHVMIYSAKRSLDETQAAHTRLRDELSKVAVRTKEQLRKVEEAAARLNAARDRVNELAAQLTQTVKAMNDMIFDAITPG